MSFILRGVLLALLYLGLVPGANAGALKALAVGEMAGVQVFDAPVVPEVTGFTTFDGAAADLGDYAGQVVLLNFWATWCAPCRKEMPGLDRVQAQLGPEGLAVVTMAFGRHNPAAMERFWEMTGIENLPLHWDRETALAQGFGVTGLPHTVILDRAGRVRAELRGDAEWDSPEAVALLRAALAE